MLVVVALVFPGLLILLMLGMARVERWLGRGLLTDQVGWMLDSEIPADQVEVRVTERLGAPLAGVTNDRAI